MTSVQRTHLLWVSSVIGIMQSKRRKTVIGKILTKSNETVGRLPSPAGTSPFEAVMSACRPRRSGVQHIQRSVCWITITSASYWSINSILAGAQIGHRVLHRRVGEVGVLLGFEPQTGQTGVAGVSVHVGAGGGSVGARGCSHRHRVQGCGTVEVVEVAQVVEPRSGNPGHR